MCWLSDMEKFMDGVNLMKGLGVVEKPHHPKRRDMYESEVETILEHLDLSVADMVKNNICPGVSYWQIYNWLATHDYKWDFKLKRFVHLELEDVLGKSY